MLTLCAHRWKSNSKIRTMDAQPKKRKRGPYLKKKIDVEDETELTLSVDSSYANFKEEYDEVLKQPGEVLKPQHQATSSSSSGRENNRSPGRENTNTCLTDDNNALDSIAQCSEMDNEEDDESERTAGQVQDIKTPSQESVDEEISMSTFPVINLQNIPEKGDDDHDVLLDFLFDDPFIGSKVEDEDDIFYELSINDEELTVEENLNNDDIDSEPLYPGASVNVGAFMLLISIFSTKYNLIGDGVEQLLKIIALALPNGHKLCTSLHSFKMYFRNLRNPLVEHYYCARCLAYQNNNRPGKKCTVCESAMDKLNQRYFLEMPIENQLMNLLAQNGFYNNLQGRFKKSFNNSYADITDGSLYRQLYNNDGPLSSPDNLSFVLNTDGAPVFKSSKVSIWPIFLVINELPFKIRMKKENMILAALWFGNEKPAMGTFLKPLQKSFMVLKDGIKCFSPERGEFLSKCFLLAATADLPARSLLCNSVQFNGKFGCWKCLQPGETAPVGKGHTHVFPYQKEDPMGPIRTAESVRQNSIQALRNTREKIKNPAVFGVKGPSWISYFPYFDCVQGIAIDYMHGVLLGVQKLLLTLWFSPKHKNRDFSISDLSDQFNVRLQNIHPTLDITRLPRPITDMKYWKASEYRSFLLYYGGPVMQSLLDEARFIHYMCLVNAVHILLGNGSSVFDVNRAEKMLLTFCEHFEHFYSRSFMTLNVHQLVHMAQGVRCLGPLYTHSCFPFEDKNGFVLKLIRGTQNIDTQIITGVSFIQKMPELKQNCLAKGSVIEQLCHSIENPHSIQRVEKISDNAYVLGGIKQRQLSDDEFDALCRFTGTAYVTDNLPSFKRLEKDNCLIYGMEYVRMTKRDNSTIMFTQRSDVKFGRVRCFLKLIENVPVAVVEELNCVSYNNRSNLLSVKQSDILTVVPVDSIKMLCMLIHIEDQNQMFVCKFPNRLECD